MVLYQTRFSKEIINRIYSYIEFYFKKLVHVFVEAGISKICRVDWQLETHRRVAV